MRERDGSTERRRDTQAARHTERSGNSPSSDIILPNLPHVRLQEPSRQIIRRAKIQGDVDDKEQIYEGIHPDRFVLREGKGGRARERGSEGARERGREGERERDTVRKSDRDRARGRGPIKASTQNGQLPISTTTSKHILYGTTVATQHINTTCTRSLHTRAWIS